MKNSHSVQLNGYPLQIDSPIVPTNPPHTYIFRKLTNLYSVRLTVAEKPVTFQLIDTAGQVSSFQNSTCENTEHLSQEQFNVIRRLSYHQSNIFLVCFNLIDPISFQNVKERWLPELKEHAPKVPFILVGLKSDGRTLSKTKSVKTDEGEQMARKIGAKCYVECSACTQVRVCSHSIKHFD